MATSAEIWPCPKCTYHNEIDILKCILCTTDKPLEPSSNHNINNKNDKSEQEDDDDLDPIFDLTQYDDSNKNKNKNKNKNHAQNTNNKNKSPLKSYPTEISETSIPDLEQHDQNNYYDNHVYDDNDYDDHNDNDLEYQKAIELSRITQMSETQQIQLAYTQSLQTAPSNINNSNNSNNSNNNSIYGKYPELYERSNSHNTNNNNTNNTNDSDIDIIDNTHNNNNRKRKRNIKNDRQSPAKKRKIDEQNKPKPRKRKKKKNNTNNNIQPLDDTVSENMNNMNLNDNNNNISLPYEKVDPQTLSKKDRKRVNDAYQKFLPRYMKGNFALRTVCIEYGPKFCGRSQEFTKILSDGSWRPSQLELPKEMPFEACNNNNLPPFVCRFKHYTLNTKNNEQAIFCGSNNENEFKKLHGYKIKGLAEYFLPRLINKNKCIYSSYVMIRLNWNNFKKLWNENKFISMIQMVKQMENVGIINIILEDVVEKITKIQNQNIRGNGSINNGTEFKNEKDLKDRMTGYFFGDKQLHFKYTRNQKQSAEFVVRVARSVADDRFKKIRVNQLSISDHNMKGIKGDKNTTGSDMFFRSLVVMHNMSEKKAGGIIAVYPTVKSLMNAYRDLSEEEGELLLENVTPAMGSMRIGQAISKRVYNVFYKNRDANTLLNA